MAEILPADDAGIAAAARALAAGQLVVYPTETYYALGADPGNPEALLALCALKSRASEAPLPLILSGPEALGRWVARVPPRAQALIDAHWPGPLTLVLPARAGLDAALVGRRGIGVRVSPHPVARALAEAARGGAVVSTSANLGGQPPGRGVSALEPGLLAGIAVVLDGGETPGNAPSTVAAIDEAGAITVLRPGPIAVG